MPEETIYLKSNVAMEPLVNQWYAWIQLIAPATAAFHIANAHLKIMGSYAKAPQTHVAALKNPAFAGGPFINYGGKRVAEIRDLMERTRRDQRHMLAFVKSVRELNDLLAEKALGQSLEPLYASVPEPLRGLVELVYDLNHKPSLRLIEGLLYKSPYYDERCQSISLFPVESDTRSFAFSTPRLADEQSLHVSIPFADERLDALAEMCRVPRPAEYLSELLGLDGHDPARLASLVTHQAPPPVRAFDEEGIRVRYFGHACVLIETRQVSILTDPVISYPYETAQPRFTLHDLPPRIDYVLISHSHPDHLLFESLIPLRHRIGQVVVPRSGGSPEDPSLKLALKHTGFERVIELEEMETIELANGAIVSLPFLGEHGDLNIRTKNALLVNLLGRTFLFAADSNNLENRLYEYIYQLYGAVDFLFIGMECDGAPLSWIYGSLLLRAVDRKMDQSRTLSGSNFERARQMVETLKPEHIFIYAMGQEPWLSFLTSLHYSHNSKQIVESDKLIAFFSARDITCERPFGWQEWLLSPAHDRSHGGNKRLTFDFQAEMVTGSSP